MRLLAIMILLILQSCSNKKITVNYDSDSKDLNVRLTHHKDKKWREYVGILRKSIPCEYQYYPVLNCEKDKVFYLMIDSNSYSVSMESPVSNLESKMMNKIELVVLNYEILPHQFMKYMLDWQPEVSLKYLELSSSLSKEEFIEYKVLTPYFDDSIEAVPTKFLLLNITPYLSLSIISNSKNYKSIKAKKYNYIWIGNDIYASLYPTNYNFQSQIVYIWDNYIHWIKQEVKNDKNHTYHPLKIWQTIPFKLKVSNYLRRNFYDIQSSYFELLLWQLYEPSVFKVGDKRGKYRSLTFTSNNPEYPGIYEVKFNIYQPYYFKVFKR